MIKILFVCLGNICRSPMAEFVMKDLAAKHGLESQLYIASAATSTEECGNPVHPGTRNKLRRYGISTDGKYAVTMQRSDYEKYDYIIGMEPSNIRAILRIIGSDPQHKVHCLLDFTDRPGAIADPWFTGDFDKTYVDILEGCQGLLKRLCQEQHWI